jgi:DDE superfamily endonuclease
MNKKLMIIALVTVCLNLGKARWSNKRRRKASSFLRRMNWEEFFLNDPIFMQRALRMPVECFEKLTLVLAPSLRRNEVQAARRGGAISPNVRLFATLRWLAGGSYLDIKMLCGISKTAVYDVISHTLNAIIECNDPILDNIHFPQTNAECEESANGFRNVSYGDAIVNCVSVHDGYLVLINTPCANEVGNVRAFFNGHYQAYGINVQAACDSNCCFNFIADREAINEVKLGNLIESLPYGYVSIGDAAYNCTEKLCALFSGDAAKKKSNDSFNYYASQCRIRIEMAFGWMTNKWQILRTPIRGPVKKVKKIILAIARLHNFIINEQLKIPGGINGIMQQANELAAYYTPTTLHDSHGSPLENHISFKEYSSLKGNSTTCLRMVRRVESLGSQRPRKSNK